MVEFPAWEIPVVLIRCCGGGDGGVCWEKAAIPRCATAMQSFQVKGEGSVSETIGLVSARACECICQNMMCVYVHASVYPWAPRIREKEKKHTQSISPQRQSQQRKGLRGKKTNIVRAGHLLPPPHPLSLLPSDTSGKTDTWACLEFSSA